MLTAWSNPFIVSMHVNVAREHYCWSEWQHSEEGKRSSSGHSIPWSLFGCAIVWCAFVMASWRTEREGTASPVGRFPKKWQAFVVKETWYPLDTCYQSNPTSETMFATHRLTGHHTRNRTELLQLTINTIKSKIRLIDLIATVLII